MNFQCRPVLEPLKVFVINPLAPASQLIIVKIMSGVVFGYDQLIDLNLIVYSNEMKSANAFSLEIESCAFSCTNSIKVSSDLPSVCDVDVFCFLTNFNNPNLLKTKGEYDEQFDALYLTIKSANSFRWSDDSKQIKTDLLKNVHFVDKEAKLNTTDHDMKMKRRPIFMVDGLVALDILQSLSKDLPHDIFFCPTPITGISKSVLGDYLNVHCNKINNVLVWAANDEVFHVEVEKPLIVHDAGDTSPCKWNMVGKDFLESRNLDTTQFSASWMKKEFIEKVVSSASKNPYGCIYRAADFSKTLRDIWLTRNRDEGGKVYTNIGVISDGSLGTIKGYPYVLPTIFNKDDWTIDSRFAEDIHVKQEIKRINKVVQYHHQQLISFCEKFLQDNIVHQALVAEGDDSDYTN